MQSNRDATRNHARSLARLSGFRPDLGRASEIRPDAGHGTRPADALGPSGDGTPLAQFGPPIDRFARADATDAIVFSTVTG